ncbi:AAA family ATPase [Symbiobacterium thermophilum]|uniref:AAA family ATPase n=1 Tax=Symbiobacterium thermophilum TaxID=2734 RepID=UPI00235451D5|nr:AAA family ATPase [Symbiobacterium thermophilum]
MEDLQRLPPLTWLIDQHLPAGGLAVLYGPSGGGKSFVALDMGMSVATGTPWAGFATKSGPVVYVSAEGAAGLQQRVNAWTRARGVKTVEMLRFCLQPIQLMDEMATRDFIQELEKLPSRPSLVIFDTLARCLVGGDENSSRDVGLFVHGVDQVRATTGAAVMIVHHTGKKGNSERGSSALRAAADAMLSLQVENGVIRLKVDKLKEAPGVAPVLYFRLKQEGNSCVVTLADGHARNQTVLTEQQRRVLETLSRLSDVSTASQWQTESGIPESSFFRAIKTLQDFGYVETRDAGKSKGYTLTDKGRQALTLT